MAGPSPRLTRRRLLQLGLALPLPLALAACDGDEPEREGGVASTTPPSPSTAAAGGTLAPTPACDDGDDPTLSQTEGPFFAPDSPERASLLEPGLGGTRLTITGAVVDTGCRPVPRAPRARGWVTSSRSPTARTHGDRSAARARSSSYDRRAAAAVRPGGATLSGLLVPSLVDVVFLVCLLTVLWHGSPALSADGDPPAT